MNTNAAVFLLVNGYIRENTTSIAKTFIPPPIVDICLHFYNAMDIAFYLSPQGLFIANFDHNHSHYTNWNCKVYDLYDNQKNILKLTDYWFTRCCGLTYAPNVQLPHKILYKVNTLYNYDPINSQKKRYSILFKCGGKYASDGPDDCQNKCGAIILDENQLYNTQYSTNPKHMKQSNIVTAYYWKLPNLMLGLYGNNLLYSSKYGLLSIGGDSSHLFETYNCYKLSFNFNGDFNQKQWEWKTFCSPYHIRLVPNIRMSSCLVTDNNDINKETIVVCGGYDANKYINEIKSFDLYTNKWNQLSNLNIGRCEAGIYHDMYDNNKIYIGGGDSKMGALHDVECFDMDKNKSYLIEPTRMQHDNYPLLWRQGQLLCIASVGALSNGFEWIDLRQGKTWKVVYFPGSNKSLSSLFGQNVPSDKYITSEYRFVK